MRGRNRKCRKVSKKKKQTCHCIYRGSETQIPFELYFIEKITVQKRRVHIRQAHIEIYIILKRVIFQEKLCFES